MHPTFLAYAPALLVMSGPFQVRFWQGPPFRKAVGLGALATACALLPVLPWTIRNCRVMDRCTLVSTNGGWNLAIGSFPRATGRFETLRASDGCDVVTGQVQQDACWRDLALRTIARDFDRWIGLMPKKLGFTFDHESFPIEYLHQADPDRWSEKRRQRGRALLTLAHRALLTLAAFGVIRARARSRTELLRALGAGVPVVALATFAWWSDASPFYLLALAIAAVGWAQFRSLGPVSRWALFCLAATMITHAVFFGEDRYHMVITPMLCLLGARAFARSAEDTFNRPHLKEGERLVHTRAS